MARGPEVYECLVPEIRYGERRERVYITELARYLHHPAKAIRKFAKQHGYLRRYPRFPNMDHVAPHAARQIILWARTIQGEWYVNGKDFHAYQDKIAKSRRECRWRAEARAKAAQNP